jgi:hypothetical protein
MRKIIIAAFSLGLVALISCQKDNESNKNPSGQDYIEIPNYFPLAIGNYWVYENYKIENHQETLLDNLDSLRITKDTLIGGETFFILEGERFPPVSTKRILRDSLHYIIDNKGSIYFADEVSGFVYYNHTEYDNNGDTLFNMQYRNEFVDEPISIPAGDFNAINRVTDFITFPQTDLSDTLKYRSVNSYFVDGLGQITDNIFYASAPFHYEKRLVRYHIEEQP